MSKLLPNERIQIYVVGDTHFGHDNIIKYCKRPFTTEEQNTVMIARWNATVRETDLVIHMGDFCMHKGYEGYEKWIKSLNGRKILVRGNHDRKSNHFYLTNGWDFVCDDFRLGRVLFTHRPVAELPKGIAVNIHGHTHDRTIKREPGWINVSVERIDYTPIQLEKILSRVGLHDKRYKKGE